MDHLQTEVKSLRTLALDALPQPVLSAVVQRANTVFKIKYIDFYNKGKSAYYYNIRDAVDNGFKFIIDKIVERYGARYDKNTISQVYFEIERTTPTNESEKYNMVKLAPPGKGKEVYFDCLSRVRKLADRLFTWEDLAHGSVNLHVNGTSYIFKIKAIEVTANSAFFLEAPPPKRQKIAETDQPEDAIMAELL